MSAADLPPDLLDRAASHGLVRHDCWWTRLAPGLQSMGSLVWQRAAGDVWCWGPEGQPAAERFATEAEALAAACDWLDAGEPEVRP